MRPDGVRPAQPADVPALLASIRALAAYERAPEAVTATEEHLRAALFGERPQVFCHVAEDAGRIVGFALWYVTFSTWLGRHGIWLEDLFVDPAARGRGVGGALLRELARIGTERGYKRMEWWVLDWNEPAQRFYRSVGATAQDEWTVWRLEEAELYRLASSGEAGPVR